MQKWEYLIIRGGYSGSGFYGFKPRFLNDQEWESWDKLSLFSLMNELGNDGWELVCSLGYYPGNNENELLFKRPKP